MALPPSQASDIVTTLHSRGVEAATIIGYATTLQDVSVRLA
jgi:hypothetical protein